jgi:hypothetical protein
MTMLALVSNRKLRVRWNIGASTGVATPGHARTTHCLSKAIVAAGIPRFAANWLREVRREWRVGWRQPPVAMHTQPGRGGPCTHVYYAP